MLQMIQWGVSKHLKLAGVAMAAIAVFAVAAPSASAKSAPEVSTYLALGDAQTFGVNLEQWAIDYPNDAPAYFEENYVNEYATFLRKSHKGLVVVNDACPGDSVESLIGTSPELGGKAGEANEPCGYAQRQHGPLHNSTTSGTGRLLSQVEEALSVLNGGHPAHPVDEISMEIPTERYTPTPCHEKVEKERDETGTSQYETTYDDAEVICEIDEEFVNLDTCEKRVKKEYEENGSSEFLVHYPPFDPLPGQNYHFGTTPRRSVELCEEAEKAAVKHWWERYTGQVSQAIKDILYTGGYAKLVEAKTALPIVVIGEYNPYELLAAESTKSVEGYNSALEAVVGEYPGLVKFVNPLPLIDPGHGKGGKAAEKTIGCTSMMVERRHCAKAQSGEYLEMGNTFDVSLNEATAETYEAANGGHLEFNGGGSPLLTAKGDAALAKLMEK